MSFTNDDILVLARAGFTSQQISALNSLQTGASTTQPRPSVLPTSPVQPVQPVQPTQPTQPTQSTTGWRPPIPEQQVTLDTILNAIQQSAIHQTEQPKQPTTDDILAEIINPPTK